MKRSSGRPAVQVTGDGTGIASHAGSLLLVELAELLGLREGLSVAMRPTRQRRSKHDPGDVLLNVAVMLADGGDCLSDLKVLRDQPDLLTAHSEKEHAAPTWKRGFGFHSLLCFLDG